jgi:hypothetical protein
VLHAPLTCEQCALLLKHSLKPSTRVKLRGGVCEIGRRGEGGMGRKGTVTYNLYHRSLVRGRPLQPPHEREGSGRV